VASPAVVVAAAEVAAGDYPRNNDSL